MVIADLHIHSRFSRATSREGDAPHLDAWARRKGIGLVGTGDFTHPAWRAELAEHLIPAEEGLYRLKDDLRLETEVAGEPSTPRFVLSAEISCIYKKNGRVRKVHNVILLPGLEEAEILSRRLEAIGNVHSDGRPILGLDSRDLLEITLDACPDALFIPAHIWTPHFSLFGAFSGFDTIEECFGDLTPHIHALETGLSSDPPMNWRVPMLDGYTLVSHSDAHSPSKLGREADLMDIDLSYAQMKRAIETGEGFEGTVEFFPEEGKYHLDGHRNCRLSLTPEETKAYGGKCPVCGRKITIGVQHRVEELAARPEGYIPDGTKRFESLMPLQEAVASCAGISASGKKAEALYFDLLRTLGPEFTILRDLPLHEIESKAGALLAEGIGRLRRGEVVRTAGYDGEYGRISLFRPDERERLQGQMSLFGAPPVPVTARLRPTAKPTVDTPAGKPDAEAPALPALNEEQRQAVEAEESTVMVIAGPGTGKTATLVSRIAYLIEEKRVRPRDITAVTFTNQAAAEMRERLEKRLGRRNVRPMTIGTFHAICLSQRAQAGENPVLVGETEARSLADTILKEYGLKLPAGRFIQAVSRRKNGMDPGEPSIPDSAYDRYGERLCQWGVLDFDDLLLRALEDEVPEKGFPYLLVDEFQDINSVQFRLVEKWAASSRSLFVIGDPDQSIYGFRGADAACFDKLGAVRPQARIIRLVRNYRSTPEILGSALAAIQPNGGEPRVLRAQAAAGPLVRLLTAETDFSEAVFVAKEIARLTGGMDMLEAHRIADERIARPFSDIAVLCRTNRQLELLEKCLRRDSIPCIITAREDYLSSDEVRGILGFFTWLCAPSDIPALRASLTWLFHCPADLLERAEAFAPGEPSFADWRASFGGFYELNRWLDRAEEYAPRVEKEKPRRLLEQLLADLRLPLTPSLEKLLNAAVFHSRMPAFLQNLLLGEEGDLCRAGQKNYTAGAVRLMTLHASKGLEFPVVFLCGVKAGVIPYESKKHPADPAEERRLFYVGMTRAREELILMTAPEKSEFLADLPAARLETGRVTPAGKPAAAFEQTSLFV